MTLPHGPEIMSRGHLPGISIYCDAIQIAVTVRPWTAYLGPSSPTNYGFQYDDGFVSAVRPRSLPADHRLRLRLLFQRERCPFSSTAFEIRVRGLVNRLKGFERTLAALLSSRAPTESSFFARSNAFGALLPF